MGLFSKNNSAELERQNHDLIDANERLITRNNELASQIRMHNTHREFDMNALQNDHKLELQGYEHSLESKSHLFDSKISLAITKKTRELEKEHDIKMARLEKEHAEKIAKCDRSLESDKAEYRKYLRAENNKIIDTLTNENTRLVKDNANLRGENLGLHGSVNCMEGQVKTMADTMNKFVAVLPKITADFTTPNVAPNVNMGTGNKIDGR